jgi:hypothetical protein
VNRLIILGLVSIAAALGCTHVAPWQRGALAHPTMTAPDLASPGSEHVTAVQEGASGGGRAAAGGCGCN